MLVREPQSPGRKLAWAIVIALVLAVPLLVVWSLVYDRRSQSEEASQSITAGWGGRQVLGGPLLVIPYRAQTSETVVENGRSVTRSRDLIRELTIAPTRSTIKTLISPELRKRSLYEAVVYDARTVGAATFAMPSDMQRAGIEPSSIDFSRAELRFAISDPRGLASNAKVATDGKAVELQPGQGSSGGKGFFAWVDAARIASSSMSVTYDFAFRGNGSIGIEPLAGQTDWNVQSAWPHPSFVGEYLPNERTIDEHGFTAHYSIGNLALGRSLMQTSTPGENVQRERDPENLAAIAQADAAPVGINLVQPVDLYSKVDRATKYGFLFIGFTFLALLMFDVVGGARVSPVEYLLTGAGLVLFFVILLALAEIIGFLAAYILASAAIVTLLTAYIAAILKSWRRAQAVGALLVGLYAVLYVLLSLEAYSLLIGSLLLFLALAGIMYVTRRIDWSAREAIDESA